MKSRIVVLGASGLVGSTLTDVLLKSGQIVVPVIHSPGNAWRLARLGVTLRTADILSAPDLDATFNAGDIVINCTRGGPRQMIDGLANIIKCARRNRIGRLVHLSSVAVYGEPPPPESSDESAPTHTEKNTYGWYKMKQDEMVRRAASKGLSAIVLCPPNIIGPYAYLPLKILDTLATGTFCYVAEGENPCNTVDVRNLCHAIQLSTGSAIADGRRLFITDGKVSTWRDLVHALRHVVPTTYAPGNVTSEQCARILDSAPKVRPSFARALKHLISSDVRNAIRKDPMLARADTAVRKLASLLGSDVEQQIRYSVEGPKKVKLGGQGPTWDASLLSMQMRTVSHSCKQATLAIGYEPIFSTADSMFAFNRWITTTRGLMESTWPLAKQLY